MVRPQPATEISNLWESLHWIDCIFPSGFRLTIAAKIITKCLYKRSVLAQLILYNYKTITLQNKILSTSSYKQQQTIGSKITKKSSGGITLIIVTKIITKEDIPRNYFSPDNTRWTSRTRSINKVQKNPRAHKNKIGPPPPKKNPKYPPPP